MRAYVRRGSERHVVLVAEAFLGGPIALVQDGDKKGQDRHRHAEARNRLVDEEQQQRGRAKRQQRQFSDVCTGTRVMLL